jgi:uncharacterized lipoprotein YmbA
MKRPCFGGLAVATALLPMILAGCARSGQTRYYTLAALAPATAAPVAAGPSLGLGPVRASRHLRQAAMVQRTTVFQLRLRDFDLWGEPVEEGIGNAVAANLGQLTGAQRIVRYPWRPTEVPDRHVSLQIEAFELAADGQAELRARWEVRDASGTLVAAGTTTVLEPANGRIDELAAALSRALLTLSRELAAAVSE